MYFLVGILLLALRKSTSGMIFLIRLQKKNQNKEEKDIKIVLAFLSQFVRA